MILVHVAAEKNSRTVVRGSHYIWRNGAQAQQYKGLKPRTLSGVSFIHYFPFFAHRNPMLNKEVSTVLPTRNDTV